MTDMLCNAGRAQVCKENPPDSSKQQQLEVYSSADQPVHKFAETTEHYCTTLLPGQVASEGKLGAPLNQCCVPSAVRAALQAAVHVDKWRAALDDYQSGGS